MADEDFLRRWARRKSEARQGGEPVPSAAPPMPQPAATTAAPVVAAVPVSSVAAQAPTPATLPDPAQLESGADISAFMAKGVDDLLRRKALKTLFSDPHFNVMDRMDVYIDDYSIADPLPPDWLDKLEQVTHLGERRDAIVQRRSGRPHWTRNTTATRARPRRPSHPRPWPNRRGRRQASP